jgi:hypothetical protein
MNYQFSASNKVPRACSLAGQAKTKKNKEDLLDMAEAWNYIASVQRDVTRQSAFDGIGTATPVHF